jgi:hypothetical protein
MISVEPQPTMEVNIHNQFRGFKLTSRKHFNIGANWNGDEELPWMRRTSRMSVNLIPFLATFEGSLTYVLWRKYVQSDNRLKPAFIRLFVAWKSECYKKFRALIHFIECDRQVVWNKYKLKDY